MIGQPLFGHLSDKTNKPLYVIAGPVLACFGASMLPLSPNYTVTLIFVLIWSIGTAVFHPQGSGGIGHLSSVDKISSSLAFFGLGGMLAGAFSPIYAVGLVKVFGFTWMPVAAMIPVLIFAAVTYHYIPDIQDESSFTPSTENFISNFRNVFGQVHRIWLVAFSRAVSGQGLRFFLPLLISSRGGGLAEIGTVLFIITIGASISPILCGRIADIFGARRTLVVILLLIPFLLVPASLTKGIPSIVLFMVGYALLTATEPITNAMAQQAAPHARGMASSIIMGFAFGLGGVVTAPLGAVADFFGLTTTMLIIAVIPSLSVPVILSRKWK